MTGIVIPVLAVHLKIARTNFSRPSKSARRAAAVVFWNVIVVGDVSHTRWPLLSLFDINGKDKKLLSPNKLP